MKLIVDENIPYGKEAFSEFGEVTLFNGRAITNDTCKEADILIVRSITKVNEDLLSGTNIKFAGSATTGDDHFDKDYLTNNNITYYVAAGCNAYSVAEYVFAAISQLATAQNFSYKGKKLGIVGAGKIGSKVAAIAESLGFEVILNDPPLQRETGDSKYRSLEEALSADIITFHVPLNKTGVDKTYHLIDKEKLNLINEGSIVINSSRGQVIDNIALKERLQIKNDITTVLDVWENEPGIDKELTKIVNLGSPHIAGYSLEGKVNGTTMVYKALCNYLKTEPTWQPDLPTIAEPTIDINIKDPVEKITQSIFNHVYKINEDYASLKEGLDKEEDLWGKHFDQLRKNYPIRRELSNYSIKNTDMDDTLIEQINKLRLNLI